MGPWVIQGSMRMTTNKAPFVPSPQAFVVKSLKKAVRQA
jgi:hypothetical protein